MFLSDTSLAVLIVVGLIVLSVLSCVLNEYDRAVIFRLGRVLAKPGDGD
jgi:hypothetical protein